MCSEEMIWYLTQLVQLLGDLHRTKDANFLEVIDMACSDACYYLEIEKDDCLDSDPLLRRLENIFKNVSTATHTCIQQQLWDTLVELAAELTIVRDQIKQHLKGRAHDIKTPDAPRTKTNRPSDPTSQPVQTKRTQPADPKHKHRKR